MKQHVIIAMRNTLAATGLQHLLHDRFSVDALVVPDPDDVTLAHESDLFFTDGSTFLAHLPYFLPRRQNTIVVDNLNSPPDGIAALLRPDAPEQDLAHTIATLLNHTPVNPTAHPSAALSQRENEVLRLVALGRLNKQIADELGISLNTVMTHRKNISSKLGIRSASGLTFYAIMHALVPAK